MLIDLSMLKRKYNLNIKGILHFGAHLAEEAPIYNSLNIKQVLWFEANPKLAEISAKSVQPKNIHIVYNELISDTDGDEHIFYITNNGQSSSMLKLARHASYYPEITVTETIKLKTKKFSTFAKEKNVDISKYNFLNIDVQGAELSVIKGFGELLRNIDYIYTEVNTEYLYENCALLSDIDEYLTQYGFYRVEISMTDKNWGDALYIKKNKKTLIAGHILPQEIDSLDRQMVQLENSSKYLASDDHVEIYFTLNLSPTLFGWEKSSLNKQFFIDKFKQSELHCAWAKKVIFEIIEDNSLLGTADQKRKIVRTYDRTINDYIFLDSDIYFHETLLGYLLFAAKSINNKYYVIVPQTVKLWDYTWDVLTHQDFMSEPYGFEHKFDPRTVLTQNIENTGLIESPVFKFATGWFNLFSAALWEFVDVPDEIGPYGTEDTYCVWAAEIMKKKNYDVQQYLLHGQYIAEDYIYKSPYADKVCFYSMKKKCIDNSNNAMPALLKKFDEKLPVNI